MARQQFSFWLYWFVFSEIQNIRTWQCCEKKLGYFSVLPTFTVPFRLGFFFAYPPCLFLNSIKGWEVILKKLNKLTRLNVLCDGPPPVPVSLFSPHPPPTCQHAELRANSPPAQRRIPAAVAGVAARERAWVIDRRPIPLLTFGWTSKSWGGPHPEGPPPSM